MKSSSRNEQLSIRKVSSVCSCLCIVAWIACEKVNKNVNNVSRSVIVERYEHLWYDEEKHTWIQSLFSSSVLVKIKTANVLKMPKAAHISLVFQWLTCLSWVFSPNAQKLGQHFCGGQSTSDFIFKADEAHSLSRTLLAVLVNVVFPTPEMFAVRSCCWSPSAVKQCRVNQPFDNSTFILSFML